MVDYKKAAICGLVSVIIPTYKRSDMLGRAIDSVLEQTYDNVEVIVVDDNSDGDDFRKATSALMLQYVNNPKVHYIQHERNMNGSAARNTGIIYSQGEYIAFLDDDDYFLNTKIEISVRFLMSADECYGGVCTNYVKKNNSYVYKIGNSPGIYDDCYQLLTKRVDYAAGSTLLCKRSTISKVGLFDASFVRHQDWEFLIRYFRSYKLRVLEDVGVVICTDGIRTKPNSDIMFQMKQKLLSQFCSDIEKLGTERKRDILHTQWLELFDSYLKEKRYASANEVLKSKIGFINLKHNDCQEILYSFIIGICPSITNVIYYLYSKRCIVRMRNMNLNM